MTRAEHVAWAKERALDLVDGGDLPGALVSLASDFQKHPETRHPSLGMFIALVGPLHIGDAGEMRRFIEGFAE